MLTRENAKAIADKVLSYSSFPECDITLESSEQAFIRFALNGITTSGFVVTQSLEIRSTKDGRNTRRKPTTGNRIFFCCTS